MQLLVPDQTGIADDSSSGDTEPAPLWTVRLAPDAPVRFGDDISLRLDLTTAYFFDPATGETIGPRSDDRHPAGASGS